MACAIGLPIVIVSSACDMLVPTEPSSGAPRLGRCGLTPNYVSGIGLHRFRTFPITLRVAGVQGTFGESTIYTPAIQMAVESWRRATGGVVIVNWSYGAPNTSDIVMFAVGSVQQSQSSDAAGVTTYRVNADGIVQDVQIQIRRYEPHVERAAVIPRELVIAKASTIAHELGHALAVGGHSPFDGDLMMNGGNYSVNGRQEVFITNRDVNTWNEAYCR
jgi:predicted Zn-dependent protease